MKTRIFDGRGPDGRRDLVQRLRQMEIIESLLEFDLTSLELYADSIADERQRMTRQLNRWPRSAD